MIIDYNQKRDGIDISYVKNNGQIGIEEIFLDKFFKFVECDEFDPQRIKELKSFHNSFVKKDSAKYFRHHNINEFLSKTLLEQYNDIYQKINTLNIPNVFAVDIETDITSKGYSDQHKAENTIRAITITDSNLNSVLFVVKNPEHETFNAIDMGYIDNIVNQALTDKFSHKYEYQKNIRVFDTEIEMLNVFLECINKYFHLIIGWNFFDYDWQYIFNRCENLGISTKKASPTNKLSKKRVEISRSVTLNLELPMHRIISDYMLLFKESLIYNNLESYSLNNCSNLVLGIEKVEYDGNLGYLYRTDYLRYIAYTFVDSIITMLIHKITNLLTVDFFQSYYTNVPYNRLSQNSISEALVYQELRNDNIILLESEKTNNPKRKYKGGFVKDPVKKIINCGHGIDYGSLYPNTMITLGLSPEAKVDKVLVDDNFEFINDDERKKWERYKEKGHYCLSPMGNIYDVSKDFLYTRIEKKLLTERKIFKSHMEDIYLNIIPKLEQEINNRNK